MPERTGMVSAGANKSRQSDMWRKKSENLYHCGNPKIRQDDDCGRTGPGTEKRGHRVGTVKTVFCPAFSMDQEGSNTDRHKKQGPISSV